MENKQHIKIGVLGEMRAGKDTLGCIIADEIYSRTGKRATEKAFADGIVRLIQYAFPDAYKNGKPRKLLQELGQGCREIDPNIWVNYLFNTYAYKSSMQTKHPFIVFDVRQPNEAEALKEQGFVLIKVVASPEVKYKRIIDNGDNFTPELMQHETELSVHTLPYDYEINNSGSLNELREKIVTVLREEYWYL